MYREVSQLLLYSNLGEDSILRQLSGIFSDWAHGECEKPVLVSRIYQQVKRLLDLATRYGFNCNLWHDYLTFVLMMNENSFSLTCERVGASDGSVNHFAKADFAVFKRLFDFDFAPIEQDLGIDCFTVLENYTAIPKKAQMYYRTVSEKVRALSAAIAGAKDENEIFDLVTAHYRDCGVGMFGLNRAFRIQEDENGSFTLNAINNIDSVLLSDLIGYEPQKKELRQNTEAFVSGRAANNVLLYGDAGNHAQGVALAASRMGIKAIVCMPDGAPISKVEATKALGAEVCLVKGAYDDAYNYACQLQQETGMTFIHPFNDEEVIAGQGTIGLEILDQLPDVDAVVCSIGGGGLISGVACAIKSLNPKVKVYGVQAENAPSMKRSLEAGEAITLDNVRTFADGIAVKHPGDITLDMVRKYVDEVVTVSEDEIAAAILALMEKQKLVAEGAGAVTVAAAMFGKLPIAGKKVCCLISGGNIDVNILSRVITRGLQREGRNCLLTIALDDKPGQLLGVTQVISECGANIVGVTHERSDAAYAVTSCLLRISMETRDFAQIEEIKAKLTEQGFKLVE